MRKAIQELMEQRLELKQLRGKLQWMSTTEAVERLAEGGMKLTAPTLLRMVNREEILGKRVGKKFFVSVDDIENLLRVKST
jgi:hypothetical protein